MLKGEKAMKYIVILFISFYAKGEEVINIEKKHNMEVFLCSKVKK